MRIKSQIDLVQAIEKLRVQRHRLEGALERFYGYDLPGDAIGLEAAVMDVAVPIRVLVHHVPDKKPPTMCLLHQVDPDYWKKPIHFEPAIAQPPRQLASGLRAVSFMSPLRITIELQKGAPAPTYRFIRYKKGPDLRARVPLLNWWRNPCWDSGSNSVCNKDLILAMANKEGGAHVDGDLSAKYRVAKAQGAISIGALPVSDIAKLGSLVAYAGGELLEYIDESFCSYL